MRNVQFITRGDDIGSSHSANLAGQKVADAGLIRNLSLMAPGPFIEEAAAMLAGRKDICFGMHTTLNAEWDRAKWGPVRMPGNQSGLVDQNGHLLPDPAAFTETKPALDTVMAEVKAQLERLRGLGFEIRYIDTHMFPERFIPGFDEAMQAFVIREGLIDHMYFYRFPDGMREFAKDPKRPLAYLRKIPAGQYFLVAHPALDTPEMRQTGNADYSGEAIARGRAAETKMYSSFITKALFALAGCKTIRYDEAQMGERLTVDDICKLMN